MSVVNSEDFSMGLIFFRKASASLSGRKPIQHTYLRERDSAALELGCPRGTSWREIGQLRAEQIRLAAAEERGLPSLSTWREIRRSDRHQGASKAFLTNPVAAAASWPRGVARSLGINL